MNPMDYAERGSLKHGEITERIIGVFYDVYNELGFGFLESVQHRAMPVALDRAGLAAESKVPLPVFFRGLPVGDFEADIFVERVVIQELKAADDLHPAHEAQLLNYLKASAAEVGAPAELRAEAAVQAIRVRQRAQAVPAENRICLI